MKIKSRSILVLAAASVLFITSRLAASGPNDVDLDLDTAAGSFSIWSTAELNSTSCSLGATLVQARQHDKWLPAFAFRFENGDSTKAVQIQFLTKDQMSFTPELQVYQKGEAPKKATLDASVKLNEKFAPAFDWTNNKLRVEFNQRELTTPDLGFKVERFTISCSTAEVKIAHMKFE